MRKISKEKFPKNRTMEIIKDSKELAHNMRAAAISSFAFVKRESRGVIVKVTSIRHLSR